MLSQPKDYVMVPLKVIVGQTDNSKSRNPTQFPAEGKSPLAMMHTAMQ